MKTFRVTIEDDLFGDQSFEVRENEFILEAARRQGVRLAHSCRNGTCRTCMMQVVSGDVEQTRPERRQISQFELRDQRRLICTSTVHSNAVLKQAPKLRLDM